MMNYQSANRSRCWLAGYQARLDGETSEHNPFAWPKRNYPASLHAAWTHGFNAALMAEKAAAEVQRHRLLAV